MLKTFVNVFHFGKNLTDISISYMYVNAYDNIFFIKRPCILYNMHLRNSYDISYHMLSYNFIIFTCVLYHSSVQL